MKDIKYDVWKCNKFNDDILSDFVAVFYNLELAKSFVDYQMTLGENYVVLKNGVRIYE